MTVGCIFNGQDMAEAMVISLFVYHRLDLANAAVAGHQTVY